MGAPDAFLLAVLFAAVKPLSVFLTILLLLVVVVVLMLRRENSRP